MDMLSYSKERIPAVEPTDANAMVREVVELLESRARDKKVALETQLGDRLPRVPADPEGIHRALLNVVGNAIDAVEERPNPLVTISTQMADEHTLQIVVADNGPGITPQLQHEIFKPFVSTKGARGTGLGLPVSRKVLREHGGDLLLESQVGVGSKFTLQLPLRSPFSLDSNTIAIDPTQLPPEAN
jgi:two-component system NtrC family sensor kinase